MKSVHRFRQREGYDRLVTSFNSELNYLGLDRIVLGPGGEAKRNVNGEELLIVLQEGDFQVEILCQHGENLFAEGSRESVFSELPTAIYVPPKSEMLIRSQNGMEALVYVASCEEPSSAAIIKPEQVAETELGEGEFRYIVRTITDANSPITKRLVVGESMSSPGGWITYPAHKHDTLSEDEYPLEEIVTFKIKSPEGGVVVHTVFDADTDTHTNSTITDDETAIAIAKGYHATIASPGCRCCLLWGLAGQEKVYKISHDPRVKNK